MDPRDAVRELQPNQLLHSFASEIHANKLRVNCSCDVLCYDRARQVTVEPGASTVAGVVNISRPPVSVVDCSLRLPTYSGEIFRSGIRGKVPEGSNLILANANTGISLHHSVRQVEGRPHANTSSIRSSVSIELRHVTDRQTDTEPYLAPRK